MAQKYPSIQMFYRPKSYIIRLCDKFYDLIKAAAAQDEELAFIRNLVERIFNNIEVYPPNMQLLSSSQEDGVSVNYYEGEIGYDVNLTLKVYIDENKNPHFGVWLKKSGNEIWPDPKNPEKYGNFIEPAALYYKNHEHEFKQQNQKEPAEPNKDKADTGADEYNWNRTLEALEVDPKLPMADFVSNIEALDKAARHFVARTDLKRLKIDLSYGKYYFCAVKTMLAIDKFTSDKFISDSDPNASTPPSKEDLYNYLISLPDEADKIYR